MSRKPLSLGMILLFLYNSVTVQGNELRDGFESGTIAPELWQIDSQKDCTISVHSDNARSGKFSVRFAATGNARCELVPHTVRGVFSSLRRKFVREPFHTDRWYQFSLYLAEPWPKEPRPLNSSDNVILAQWHSSPDPKLDVRNRGPSLALRAVGDHFRLTYGWDSKLRSTEAPLAKYTMWTAPIDTEQWIDMLFRVRWSYGPDGLVQLWRDGVLVLDYNGPNAYKDVRGVYLKLGVYHPRAERVAYFDDVRVTNKRPEPETAE